MRVWSTPEFALIAFRNVSKSFDGGRTHAVRAASLEVAAGETLVLLGASGCGKSTLIKMVNRLIDPSEGRVELDGQDVRLADRLSLRRRIGYVFQGVGLFPHMTVEENAAMVLRLMGRRRSERRAKAHAMLSLVGLPPAQFSTRYPRELSGGQQQRVGVARALAADPAYLLMDEPFGALDVLTRETLQEEVLRLKRDLKKTIVFVTHDVFEAMLLGDRIGVMQAGRIEQIGTPAELVDSPATNFVRELFDRARRSAMLLLAHKET